MYDMILWGCVVLACAYYMYQRKRSKLTDTLIIERFICEKVRVGLSNLTTKFYDETGAPVKYTNQGLLFNDTCYGLSSMSETEDVLKYTFNKKKTPIMLSFWKKNSPLLFAIHTDKETLLSGFYRNIYRPIYAECHELDRISRL